jgi:hypothetical protein
MLNMDDDWEVFFGVLIGLAIAALLGCMILVIVGHDKSGKLLIGALMLSSTTWFVYESRQEGDSYVYEAHHHSRTHDTPGS